jgi:hypothetical protein
MASFSVRLCHTAPPFWLYHSITLSARTRSVSLVSEVGSFFGGLNETSRLHRVYFFEPTMPKRTAPPMPPTIAPNGMNVKNTSIPL